MDRPKEFLARQLLEPPAVVTDGDAAQAHNNRGAMRHLQGDRVGARREYEAALAADSANATALNNLGFLLAQEGRFADAIEPLRQALGLDPNNPTASWTSGTNIQAGIVFTLTQ